MWWCYLYSYLKQLSGVLCFPQALPDFFRLSSLLSISNARLLWFFCPCLWDWLCQCHFWLLVSPFLQERGDRDTGLVSDLIWLRSVNATAMAITLSLVGSARFILHPFGFILCFELESYCRFKEGWYYQRAWSGWFEWAATVLVVWWRAVIPRISGSVWISVCLCISLSFLLLVGLFSVNVACLIEWSLVTFTNLQWRSLSFFCWTCSIPPSSFWFHRGGEIMDNISGECN